MPISEKVANKCEKLSGALDDLRKQENKNSSPGPPRKGNPNKSSTLGTGNS